jgi:hypothetical protein
MNEIVMRPHPALRVTIKSEEVEGFVDMLRIDEPVYSLVTTITYEYRFSRVVQEMTKDPEIAKEMDAMIAGICEAAVHNTYKLIPKANGRPIQWGPVLEGSRTYGYLKLEAKMFGLPAEIYFRRILQAGNFIRKEATLKCQRIKDARVP